MNADVTDELHAFHRFIATKLGQEGPQLSPEQVLDEWRDLHPYREINNPQGASIQGNPGDTTLSDHIQSSRLKEEKPNGANRSEQKRDEEPSEAPLEFHWSKSRRKIRAAAKAYSENTHADY